MTPRPVYAILLNYNCWRDTIGCVESLEKSTYPSLRVLVLDGGSSDDSVARLTEWAKTKGVLPVDVERLRKGTLPPPAPGSFAFVPLNVNLGFAGANNAGLRYVLGREGDAYALVLNSDTTVAPDAVTRLVETAEADPDVALVGATLLRQHQPDIIETAGGGTFASWHGMTRTIREGVRRTDPRPPTHRMDFVSGTCMLARSAAIQRVGLMDERFFLYGEDIDWSIRFQASGYRIAYAHEAEVWHKGGGSTVHRSATHDYFNVKSALLLVHKHFPIALPMALAYSVAKCVLPKIVRGEWTRLPATARAYADFARQVSGRSTAPFAG